MDLNHNTAFEPFRDTWVSVTAKRLADGTTSTYTGQVQAAIVVGSTPGQGNAQLGRVAGDQYSVIVADAGFPAPSGPAFGDRFEHETYGELIVQQAQRAGLDWECSCVARGART